MGCEVGKEVVAGMLENWRILWRRGGIIGRDYWVKK